MMAKSFSVVTVEELEQIAVDGARRLGYEGLKDRQLEEIVSFLQGNDTFVALPTGYGKSLIYGVLPYSFDKMRGITLIYNF